MIQNDFQDLELEDNSVVSVNDKSLHSYYSNINRMSDIEMLDDFERLSSSSLVDINKLSPCKTKAKRELQFWEIREGIQFNYIKIINAKNSRNLDNAACEICRDRKTYNDDEIYVCGLCCSATHRTCYGSELIDQNLRIEGNWYCQRCKYLLDNKKPYDSVKCCYCPDENVQGIIKNLKDGRWAHVVCVNWLPDVWYHSAKNESVKERKTLQAKFEELICSICRVKQGCCIQCDYKNCCTAFHIQCAKKSDLILNWETMQKFKKDE